MWNSRRNASEGTCILQSRGFEQRDSMGSRRERLAGFVESDVSVHTNPEEQKIEAAGCGDDFFVAFAFDIQVRRDSVQAIRSIRVEIDS